MNSWANSRKNTASSFLRSSYEISTTPCDPGGRRASRDRTSFTELLRHQRRRAAWYSLNVIHNVGSNDVIEPAASKEHLLLTLAPTQNTGLHSDTIHLRRLGQQRKACLLPICRKHLSPEGGQQQRGQPRTDDESRVGTELAPTATNFKHMLPSETTRSVPFTPCHD